MSVAADVTGAAPPLAVAQEALWYQSILNPTSLAYNEAISLRKTGRLDVDALRRAFDALVARHVAWRTTFDTVDGTPVQIVGRPPHFALPVVDLSSLGAEEAERRGAELVAEMARVPYDLRRGPLVRPRLMRFPGDEHRLYLAMHHLVFDGVSVTRTVLSDLVTLYDALRAGRSDPLEEPVVTYADYARWEQEWIEGDRARRGLERWHTHLRDAPALGMPHDHPRPPARVLGGGAVPLRVSADAVSGLRAAAQDANATLFQALAAVWALLLGRHAGHDELVFATAADMRQRPEFERIVGCCLSPLVLRADLRGDPTFAELVVRVRNELLDGLEKLVPFERLVRVLHPEDTPNANPVYQAMIVLEPATATPDPAWSVHQIDSRLTDAVGGCKLDLELQLDERPGGEIVGSLIFDRDLFDRSTAERMADHWTNLAVAASAEPNAPISRLRILGPSERRRQLVEWNATATEPPAVDLAAMVRGWRTGLPASDAAPAWLDEALAGLGGVDGPVGAAAANAVSSLVADLVISPEDTVLVLPATLARLPAVALGMPLVAGARVIVAPEDLAEYGAALSRLIAKEGVTLLHAGPGEWRALIESGLRPARALRALCGGGPLTEDLADAILERCRVLWNAYGGPVTGGYCTLARVQRPGPVTLGRPLANTRAYVLDAHLEPVPVGAAGQLVLAGDGPAAAAATIGSGDTAAAQFIDDPFGPGPAVQTGDRARWRPDGRLEIAPDGLS